MGALAPVWPWIPEDDILLKNAVEAGASLESLAKGAVQFSRRFSAKEIQDRWHSLLYDPIISSDACSRMIDFERSAVNIPLRFDKGGILKDNKSVSGKRKSKSVRSCYYALRKRICHEPFDSMDLGFLVGPSYDNCAENNNESFSGNGILSKPILSNQGTDVGILHNDILQVVVDGDNDDHIFEARFQQSIDGGFPMEQNNMRNGIPDSFMENQPLSGDVSRVDELSETENFSMHALFKPEDLEGKSSFSFGQINSVEGNMGLEFEEHEMFNSPISDSGASFHNPEYSSPLSGMSIWRTFSAPDLPIDVGLGETDIQTLDNFDLPYDDDIQNIRTSNYDSHSDSKNNEVPRDHFKIPTAENYLAELSNSLLNLTNEEDELLIMDVDGQGEIEKSYYDGLSSLLVNSPNDVNQEQNPNPSNAEASCASDAHLVDDSGACTREPYAKGPNCGNELVCSFEVILPLFALNAEHHFSEGPIFCTLNTMDPEIPDNDDISLPNQFHPSTGASAVNPFQESSDPFFSSVKNLSGNEEAADLLPNLMLRNEKHSGKSCLTSQPVGLNILPETGQTHLICDSTGKFELPHGDSTCVTSRNANIVSHPRYGSTIASACAVPSVVTEGGTITNSNREKSAPDSESYRNYDPTNTCVIKHETDVMGATEDHRLIHSEVVAVGIADIGQGVSSPTNQDGLHIDSENDVPNFSDIEAMILNMDLDPDDQDLYSCEEVSRYLHEDTKKTIMRLEQGADSYMQRAIASHGAFAILYGRRSKHYIKKPEVLLGRATDDVVVDIDLGKEGRANKISRRQAIIKMDEDGSFHLQNLGKCPISVNNKEVYPGQSLILNSSCLIEIRGMPFIFETNLSPVKQYLNSIANINIKCPD